jgi:hypothetical protein
VNGGDFAFFRAAAGMKWKARRRAIKKWRQNPNPVVGVAATGW